MSKKNGRRHTAVDNGGDEKHCDAKKATGKGTCHLPAGWGTEHAGVGRCKWHGGATESHCTAAKRVLLGRAIVAYGLPREIDPIDALLEEVHRTAGCVEFLERRVQEIPPDKVSETQYAGLLSRYDRERRHGLDVNRTAIGAGIAERQVRIAEQTGALIAQVITGVLKDLGVADRPEVPAVVRRHLVAIDGGKAA